MKIESLEKIQKALSGGEVYVVGGVIRDLLISRINGKSFKPKDVDFVVRNLTLEQIADKLKSIGGKAKEVSKSFGIVKALIDDEDFDFALPRIKEIPGESGSHTDFEVEVDPFSNIEDDLGRRDITLNAMALRLDGFITMLRGGDDAKIIDPYRGLDDLKDGLIRTVGNPKSRFGEDKLRIVRVIQFACRFGFDIEEKTYQAMADMAWMLHPKEGFVTGERILMELEKVFTKGNQDIMLLVELLNKTKIGEIVFGDDFDPQVIRLDRKDYSSDDKIIAGMMALFLAGGNIDILKPSTEVLRGLFVIRTTLQVDKILPFEWFKIGDRYYLPIILNIFKDLDMPIEVVSRMMKVPLVAKELPISGQQLMEMGLKGKEIGIRQKEMLQTEWLGSSN